MTDKQKVVLKGLLELSQEESREVIRESQSFERKTFSERSSMNESLNKASRVLGPTSGTSCPCCGK